MPAYGAAKSSMKTISAFITASLVAFEERSSAARTPTQGAITATVKSGSLIGYASSRDSLASRSAIMRL